MILQSLELNLSCLCHTHQTGLSPALTNMAIIAHRSSCLLESFTGHSQVAGTQVENTHFIVILRYLYIKYSVFSALYRRE